MIHFSANQLNDFYILVALTLYGLVMIFCDREMDRLTEKKRDLHWSIPFINSHGNFLVNIFSFFISLFFLYQPV